METPARTTRRPSLRAHFMGYSAGCIIAAPESIDPKCVILNRPTLHPTQGYVYGVPRFQAGAPANYSPVTVGILARHRSSGWALD